MKGKGLVARIHGSGQQCYEFLVEALPDFKQLTGIV
jgi:hypothetical protein